MKNVGSVVVTRKTTTKTIFAHDGSYVETENSSVVVDSRDFDTPVDWDVLYDSVVSMVKAQINT